MECNIWVETWMVLLTRPWKKLRRKTVAKGSRDKEVLKCLLFCRNRMEAPMTRAEGRVGVIRYELEKGASRSLQSWGHGKVFEFYYKYNTTQTLSDGSTREEQM